MHISSTFFSHHGRQEFSLRIWSVWEMRVRMWPDNTITERIRKHSNFKICLIWLNRNIMASVSRGARSLRIHIIAVCYYESCFWVVCTQMYTLIMYWQCFHFILFIAQCKYVFIWLPLITSLCVDLHFHCFAAPSTEKRTFGILY